MTFLRLMVDMLHHPSGRICGEQLNTWVGLFRDPQLQSNDKILSPFVKEMLTSYMDHMIRIQWDDIAEHPHSSILEASWDDEVSPVLTFALTYGIIASHTWIVGLLGLQEEYDQWIGDFRSKASQLFRSLGHFEPDATAAAVSSRVVALLLRYGDGGPRDHLDPVNQQLTQNSEACIQLEALYQPLDNILHGMPNWSLEDERNKNSKEYRQRADIRDRVRKNLAEMVTALVSWNPSYIWLKFRKATLLDALKYYWQYEPSTLTKGVECLLAYLSAPDEWRPQGGNGKLSGEIVSLRKKSGVSLVSISKHVPRHLVPWLSELSEAAKKLLSSNSLLPPNQMHLYEFLSCVATAVEDPVSRSSFIADVLSHAISVLESPVAKQSISSVDGLLQLFGVAPAASNPSSVTDPQNVKAVSYQYSEIFSAMNQIVSVGKRCNEAARKRHGGIIPVQSGSTVTTANFPDEGPISIRDLAINDPFAPLWPRVFPILLQMLNVLLQAWHPEYQAVLLQNPIQRYAYAISDDEAYMSQLHDKMGEGVFGEGGTAGSVVSGVDRRDTNLAPKWSGWFNELRNTCFQMLGLVAGSRALYSPELSSLFPQFVSVVANQEHLRALEHRQLTQYM